MRETWVRSLVREDPLEKEMATYSNTLAWKIPWMEESGRLQSTGSQAVGHFLCGSAGKESAFNAGDLGSILLLRRSPGERKGYPLSWPGEFHGLYSPWGRKESDTTEPL